MENNKIFKIDPKVYKEIAVRNSLYHEILHCSCFVKKEDVNECVYTAESYLQISDLDGASFIEWEGLVFKAIDSAPYYEGIKEAVHTLVFDRSTII